MLTFILEFVNECMLQHLCRPLRWWMCASVGKMDCENSREMFHIDCVSNVVQDMWFCVNVLCALLINRLYVYSAVWLMYRQMKLNSFVNTTYEVIMTN